jgi:hypothetical protein
MTTWAAVKKSPSWEDEKRAAQAFEDFRFGTAFRQAVKGSYGVFHRFDCPDERITSHGRRRFLRKTAWGDDPKASQQPGRVVSPKDPPIRSRAPGALRSAVHPKSRYSVLPSNVFKARSNRLQIVLNRFRGRLL